MAIPRPRLIVPEQELQEMVNVKLVDFDVIGDVDLVSQRNTDYPSYNRYMAAPFKPLRGEWDGVIARSGVLFNSKDFKPFLGSVYGVPESEHHLSLNDEGDFVLTQWLQSQWVNGNVEQVSFPLFNGMHRFGGVYAHFLAECLYSCIRMMESGEWTKRSRILVPSDINKNYLDAIKMAGFTYDKMYFSVPSTLIGGEIITSQSVFSSIWYHHDIADTLRAAVGSKAARVGVHEKLYVSRRSALARRMVNEAELEAALTAQGFHVVELENIPFQEQVELFRGAKVIVGPHGSGLANVVFSSPGALLIELMPSGFPDRPVLNDRSFWNLASGAGHQYACYVIAKPTADDLWSIDVSGVLAKINRLT